MNSIKNQLLNVDANAPILGEKDYGFNTSFSNQDPNALILPFKLRNYKDEHNSANLKLYTFGTVTWGSKVKSSCNNRNTVANTLDNGKPEIIKHVYCTGALICNDS